MGIAGESLRTAPPRAQEVRTQLERMLASGIFARSERLSVFLRFVVEETIAGRGAGLKEQSLGSRLYRNGGEFDGAADPIVRVDARRLRDKLREYYSEFPNDAVLVSLPKGSYVPVFRSNAAAGPVVAETAMQHAQRRWVWLGASAALALVAGLLLLSAVLRRPRSMPAKLVRITSFPGLIGAPSLSPDGKFVAFGWKPPDEQTQRDIWIKSLADGSMRRLTNTTDASERDAAWSPDGRNIAFIREGGGVFVMPVAGGPERRVSPSGTYVGWTPDAKSVLIRDQEKDQSNGIYQIALDTLQRRCITRAPAGIGDWRFSVSPDGANLAFVRYGRPGVGDLFVVPMQGGEPRRLTDWNGILTGVAWTADGRDIIYGAAGLWRIPAETRQAGRGIVVEGAPASAANPSIVRPPGAASLLAFQTSEVEAQMRTVDLTGRLENGVFVDVKPFSASSRLDYPGVFSADSRRIAFVSARDETLPKLTGGMPQLWISALDGSGLRKLHSAPHLSTGGFSHDGRRFVYDCAAGGNSDVYVLDLAGGTPLRLTTEPSIDGVASWSHDDRFIYFNSTREASWQKPDIWRVGASGGQASRVTHGGRFRAIESPDGRHLYYSDRAPVGDDPVGKGRLMRAAVAGGKEEILFEGITPFWWSVTEQGIYFLTRESNAEIVNRYDPATSKLTRLGRLPFRVPMTVRFAVSPDARWALTGTERTEQDLMMLEGFR